MKKEITDVENRIAAAQEMLKQAQDDLNTLKQQEQKEPVFEVGKWYKVIISDSKYPIFCFNGSFEANGAPRGFGFGLSGDWRESSNIGCGNGKEIIPATKEEVELALIKEAEKRGFKGGVKFKAIPGCGISADSGYVENCSWRYSVGEKDTLCQNGQTYVYFNGTWAEILKEQPIMIDRYEVNFQECPVNHTKIDGHQFSVEFWQAAKTISEHSKAKIMIGCSKQFDVSLDTINKILNKLK